MPDGAGKGTSVYEAVGPDVGVGSPGVAGAGSGEAVSDGVGCSDGVGGADGSAALGSVRGVRGRGRRHRPRPRDPDRHEDHGRTGGGDDGEAGAGEHVPISSYRHDPREARG